MKKHLLVLTAAMLAGVQLFAQKLEISVQAGSGLFHYSGQSAESTTFVSSGTGSLNPTVGQKNYTNNPYGNKNAFSYGGYVQAQVVAKNSFIWGLQGGYEVLKSRIDVNQYYPNTLYTSSIPNNGAGIPVTGHTNLQNKNINLNPYIGYRIQINKVKLDLLPGLDIGLNLSSYDKGKVKTDNGETYLVNYKRPDAPTDVRIRLGAVASIGRIGLNASYAHGFTNYDKDAIGSGTSGAHSELLRLGLSYRIF